MNFDCYRRLRLRVTRNRAELAVRRRRRQARTSPTRERPRFSFVVPRLSQGAQSWPYLHLCRSCSWWRPQTIFEARQKHLANQRAARVVFSESVRLFTYIAPMDNDVQACSINVERSTASVQWSAQRNSDITCVREDGMVVTASTSSAPQSGRQWRLTPTAISRFSGQMDRHAADRRGASTP